MNAFRVLALSYALAVVLIAPGALEADTLVTGDPAAPVAEEPTAAPQAEPAVEPAPEPAAPADEAPVVVGQEAEEPAAEAAPVAKAAKKEPPEDEPVAKAAASGSVTISDFKFTPKTITVNVGDTVTWTNNGPAPHSATASDGSFDTGIMDKGKSGSATFNNAGTIAYICTPHPFMKGTVIVNAAASGNSSGDDSTTTDDSDTAAADDTSDDGGLPNTGGETLLIALLGLATLGAGLLLRRRDDARR